VTVTGGTVLKAIAVLNGFSSEVTSQIYELMDVGALNNVAPSATYTYPTDWPGSPGRWGDANCTLLTNNYLTDLVLESDYEPIVAIFDLGEDTTINQLEIFATETPWNNNGLSSCIFYANTQAQGGWTTFAAVQQYAGWSMTIPTVNKSESIWTVSTGILPTPIVARYVAIKAAFDTAQYFPGISEVAILSSEPVTAAPVFSAGKYITSEPKEVAITCATENATIYYTMDGSTPTRDSDVYSGPIDVRNGTVLKAMAVVDGYFRSSVTSVTYVVPDAYNRPESIHTGTATVDGDLSEWSNATWAPLDQIYNITGSTVGALETDVPEAYYAARWTSNKVYVAVKVRDASHYFTEGYVNWNSCDAIEVYLHTDNNNLDAYPTYNRSAQQYVVGIKNSDPSKAWLTVGSYGRFDLNNRPEVARAVGKVVGQWIYYEVEMTPFTYLGLEEAGDLSTSIITTLKVDDVIGLDVTVVAHNGTSFSGEKSENMKPGKGGDLNAFGLHILSAQKDRTPGDANSDGAVDVGDLGILAANYGGSGKTWAQGDFNSDGKVDVGDLGILAANYGKNSSSGSNFESDYAKVFGIESNSVTSEDATNDTESSLCSSLGLSLIAGLALMGLMLVKMRE
jgi:hypothetical protein